MDYKNIINDYFDMESHKPDEIEIKFEVQRQVSDLIKGSEYYSELDYTDRGNLSNYINKSIGIYEGKIGFDKMDSMVNGMEIPSKYLIEKMIYDRSHKGTTIPKDMAEIIKKQSVVMKPYKLSRMFENNGGYRLVFESDNETYEISIRRN